MIGVRPAVLLVAVAAAALTSACGGSLGNQDAHSDAPSGSEPMPDTAQNDGGHNNDAASAEDAPACYPLFRACTTTEQCCAPYRCLNINGLACQLEGPMIEGGQP
jgi:hypothetical protein